MKIRHCSFVLLFFLLCVGDSYADTFHYDLEMTGSTFNFDVTNLITTNTIIYARDFVANSPVFTSIEIDPLSCSNGGPPQISCVMESTVMATSIIGTNLRLDKVGFYSDSPLWSLDITDLSPVQVPESSTIVFLGIGLLGLALLRNRLFNGMLVKGECA